MPENQLVMRDPAGSRLGENSTGHADRSRPAEYVTRLSTTEPSRQSRKSSTPSSRRHRTSAALSPTTGPSNSVNPTGDDQLAADLRADELFEQRVLGIDGVASYASEERADVKATDGRLHVAMDPLDGSSNLEPNSRDGDDRAAWHGSATDCRYQSPRRRVRHLRSDHLDGRCSGRQRPRVYP